MMEIEPAVDAPIARLSGIHTPPGAVVLASSRSVAETIQTLAAAIQPWIDESPDSPVVLVALLNGGKFYADQLVLQLQKICSADFERNDIKVSTRDGDGRLLSNPEILGDIARLNGRRVLIVDDILDSGTTLRLTFERIGPMVAELKSTVLVQKNSPEPGSDDSRPKADFVGLIFSDTRWFSGAGMDMPGDPEGVARNAPLIIAYPPIF